MSTDDKTIQEEHPKLFISYSWSSPEHEQTVLKLAERLCESGVNVIIDKWNLDVGNDPYAFMERMVTDSEVKKVLIICDKEYAEKSDGRKGGVGTEAQIISPEIYGKQDQKRFAALIVEKDENGKAYLPTYYKSRIYIDMCNNEDYFEELLRWIYDKPLHVKPELGKKPSYLEESSRISLGTTASYQRALEAIKNGRPNAKGSLQEYFNTFVTNLEKFRITPVGNREFDDFVVENIEQFLPYRDEAISMFQTIAQYSNSTEETNKQLHRFFEKLIPYMEKPVNVNRWQEHDLDNFKFIIHELFLYCIAVFLEEEVFDSISFLLEKNYLNNTNYDNPVVQNYLVFRTNLESLKKRNERLNLQRYSLHADLIKLRSNGSGLHFNSLMQADFVLFMRSCKDIEFNNSIFPCYWWPTTLLFKGNREGSFEIFLRAQSKEYFELIKKVLNINRKEDIKDILMSYMVKNNSYSRLGDILINPENLINYDKLATEP